MEAVYPGVGNAFKLPVDEFLSRWKFALQWHPIEVSELGAVRQESEAWLKKQAKRKRRR